MSSHQIVQNGEDEENESVEVTESSVSSSFDLSGDFIEVGENRVRKDDFGLVLVLLLLLHEVYFHYVN